MAYYDAFWDNVAPTSSAADSSSYTIGTRFVVTSSVVRFPEWTSSYWVTGIQVYRGTYTGSFTASLWASSSTVPATLLATAFSTTSSNRSWFTMSFDSPVSISIDTEYRAATTIHANGYNYILNKLTSTWLTASYWTDKTSSLYIPTGSLFGAGGSGIFNPLAIIGTCYVMSGSRANPAPVSFPPNRPADVNWHGIDIIISGSDIHYPSVRKTGGLPHVGEQSVVNHLTGITMGGMSSLYEGTERYYQTGVTKSLNQGYTSPPSLELQCPGMWRFKWGVTAGTRQISVKSKQSGSIIGYTPSMVIAKNPSIGLMFDVSASASSSTDWTTIGPIIINPTSAGSVWVELWNNNTRDFYSSAYFDRILTS